MCELCGDELCSCDTDQDNPVDVSSEEWYRIYSKRARDYGDEGDWDYSMNG